MVRGDTFTIMTQTQTAASVELRWALYRPMFTIRRLEETLLTLYSQGALFGTVHTCIGQEACAVGVMQALDRTRDIVWSNHRSHGHFVAYSDNVEGLIGEIMGKATGVCGGVGGTQHLHERNFYSNGILGGTIPCAVGTALAEKLTGSDAITAVFFGDGAMGEGVGYESLNMAALWKIPVLFVLEDNGYAQSTPKHLEHAGEFAARAAAFGIECAEVDVTGVEDVVVAAQIAVDIVRGEQRPYFLILRTYRLAPHSKGDDTRSEAELDTYRQRDPLNMMRRELATLDADQLAEIEAEVERRLDAAVQAAKDAPAPDPQAFVERMASW
jgi:acetoin:2,6-dichlorophenolindophenol oxidoreductase subunit alpha